MTRTRLLIAAGVALALVASFVGGRFSAPLKVETRDVEKVVFKDRVVEKIVTVEKAAKVETKIVYRDRVIMKDGTITEREVEKTDAKTDTEKTADASKVEVREVEKLVTVEKITTLRPDWRVGILAGASIREPLVPIAGPLVLGLEVDRRIIGGFSAGVWVNTSGAAGVALSLEF